ncbi:Metallo-beta-lactamase [Trypanosoma melophagium]|uniref:Metallo-beta-lactamase n=1 Tax=Trypanosoma melophagium TaxID=715481 RepID=UPI00351A3D44|nr:Metallo-beta-lactamase [Trypanosoma melophagium]
MLMKMQFVRAVIVGAGASTSTPSLSCIASGTPCPTCTEALTYHPNSNRNSNNNRSDGNEAVSNINKMRNHRLNPCFLLQLRHPTDGTIHNILIDCGKTFRESAIKVLPTFGVSDLTAVMLTHDHADAAFGLDDLREFNRPDTPLDVFADERTLQSMQRVYPYLFPKDGSAVVGAWRRNKTGFIAAIKWESFTPLEKLTVNILSRVGNGKKENTASDAIVTTTASSPISSSTKDDSNRSSVAWFVVPIPVLHGDKYYSNAFLIPMHNANEKPRLLLYVSDISVVDDKFFNDVDRAKTLLGVDTSTPIEVLILDMLSHNVYFAHLHVGAAIEAAERIDASKTFFIGMSHALNYTTLTEYLTELGFGGKMAVGFDGCVVAVGNDVREGELHPNL